MINLVLTNLYTKLYRSTFDDTHKNCIVEIYRQLSIFQDGAVHSEKYNSILKDGSREWDGYYRYYNYKNNTFLTGLLPIVVKIIQQHGIPFQITDNRSRPDTTINPVYQLPEFETLRDYQREGIDIGLQNHRGIYSLATNSGKTCLAICLIESINCNTLFLTDRRELLKQTTAVFKKNCSRSVGIIGEGKFEPEDITVGMIKTIVSRLDNNKTKKQTQEYLKGVQCFFCDEAHKATAKTWKKVFFKMPNAYYRFGLSGTPILPDSVRNFALIGFTGPVIQKVTNKELIDCGVSAPATIYLIQYDAERAPSDLDYNTLYSEEIVCKEERNNIIISLIERHAKENKSILIAVESIQHGELLQEELQKLGITVPFACADLMNNKQRDDVYEGFKSRRYPIVIASMIYKEGIDIDVIDVLVYAVGEKSPVTLLQFIGRGLRNRPDKEHLIFYDFQDYHHYILRRHTKQRAKIYVDEGFPVKKIKMRN